MKSKDSNQFGVVFIVMWGGAFVVTINTKLLGGHISFFQCVCVLGYCVFPIVLGAFIVLLLHSFGVKVLLINMAVAVLTLIWSTLGASFSMQPRSPT